MTQWKLPSVRLTNERWMRQKIKSNSSGYTAQFCVHFLTNSRQGDDAYRGPLYWVEPLNYGSQWGRAKCPNYEGVRITGVAGILTLVSLGVSELNVILIYRGVHIVEESTRGGFDTALPPNLSTSSFYIEILMRNFAVTGTYILPKQLFVVPHFNLFR